MKNSKKSGFTQAPNPVKDIFSNIFAFRSVKKVNLVRGFTLIELLVVVAIIGILASLVIASLNQARSRGVDAAIKGTVSSMRAQAEILYDKEGNYDELFTSYPLMTPLMTDVEEKNGDGTADFYASGQNWYFYTPLTTSDSAGFCADSSGFAGNATGADQTQLCMPS